MEKIDLWIMSLLTVSVLYSNVEAQGTYPSQPMLNARVVDILHLDGLLFKDLNKNGGGGHSVVGLYCSGRRL